MDSVDGPLWSANDVRLGGRTTIIYTVVREFIRDTTTAVLATGVSPKKKNKKNMIFSNFISVFAVFDGKNHG